MKKGKIIEKKVKMKNVQKLPKFENEFFKKKLLLVLRRRKYSRIQIWEENRNRTCLEMKTILKNKNFQKYVKIISKNEERGIWNILKFYLQFPFRILPSSSLLPHPKKICEINFTPTSMKAISALLVVTIVKKL